MVDLVKIRKKAKKKEEAGPAPASASEAESSSRPVAESPSPPPPPAEPEPSTTRRLDDSTTSKLDRFREQAGKRREAEAARVETAPADLLELLTFHIAGEQYAVDIERIVEIVTPRPVTRIPNADPSIVGIISLRGTIVTLVDVRRKLRHARAGEPTADTRIVVIDFHGETVGFVVDRVLRVVKAAAADIESHPVVHATELDEAVRGVFRAGGALTILLDLDKLLATRALAAGNA